MTMENITIKSNDSGQRLDKFLTKTYIKLPKSLMYKLIRKKRIKLNGKRCYGETMLVTGDVLNLYVEDELLYRKSDYSFNQADDIEIVYEDENIIVAEKPVGLLSHGSQNEQFDHLANRVKKYLFQKGEYNPDLENAFAPAICSRLDRNTGGIVLAAKNAAALREANKLMRERRIHKFYRAEVVGKLSQKQGVLTDRFEKDSRQNKMIYSDDVDAKETVTAYEVAEERQHTSLLDVELITGRTHQIRAQLAHVGNPLVGDKKYGGKQMGEGKYQALYAYKITFDSAENDILNYLHEKEIISKNTPNTLQIK